MWFMPARKGDSPKVATSSSSSPALARKKNIVNIPFEAELKQVSEERSDKKARKLVILTAARLSPHTTLDQTWDRF